MIAKTYEFHIHILQHPFGWDEIIAFKKIKLKKKRRIKVCNGFHTAIKNALHDNNINSLQMYDK